MRRGRSHGSPTTWAENRFPLPARPAQRGRRLQGSSRCVGEEPHLQGRPNVPSPEAPGSLPALVPSRRPDVQATASARCTPRASQGAHRPGAPEAPRQSSPPGRASRVRLATGAPRAPGETPPPGGPDLHVKELTKPGRLSPGRGQPESGQSPGGGAGGAAKAGLRGARRGQGRRGRQN